MCDGDPPEDHPPRPLPKVGPVHHDALDPTPNELPSRGDVRLVDPRLEVTSHRLQPCPLLRVYAGAPFLKLPTVALPLELFPALTKRIHRALRLVVRDDALRDSDHDARHLPLDLGQLGLDVFTHLLSLPSVRGL